MTVRDQIVEKLSLEFTPSHLEVIDESLKHKGHAGWQEGGETHFRVRIAAERLAGLSRLARHRAVLETLSEEMNGRVHALAIEFVEPSAD